MPERLQPASGQCLTPSATLAPYGPLTIGGKWNDGSGKNIYPGIVEWGEPEGWALAANDDGLLASVAG
jgi:hypothetical protein